MRPLACDRSRAWISLRLDGELSKFEHVLLGAHMAMCRDCRRFADDVEWQTQAIRSAGLEPLAMLEEGLQKAVAGLTTLEEIARVV